MTTSRRKFIQGAAQTGIAAATLTGVSAAHPQGLEARNEGIAPVVLKVRSNKLYGALTAVGPGGAVGGTGTTWELKFAGRGEQSLTGTWTRRGGGTT